MKPILDISFYQAPSAINYDTLAANVSGVILRACYGIWKDTAFDRHYQEFTARGVPVGAYHYIIGSQSMQAQADAFNVAVG
jgi:GH25 family lysozyme M1 (1,4-beta-N-acetylmuramidase)